MVMGTMLAMFDQLSQQCTNTNSSLSCERLRKAELRHSAPMVERLLSPKPVS